MDESPAPAPERIRQNLMLEHPTRLVEPAADYHQRLVDENQRCGLAFHDLDRADQSPQQEKCV